MAKPAGPEGAVSSNIDVYYTNEVTMAALLVKAGQCERMTLEVLITRAISEGGITEKGADDLRALAGIVPEEPEVEKPRKNFSFKNIFSRMSTKCGT